MSAPIRVLVVDDSALMRKLLPQLIERDPDLKVVGTAMDGEFAMRKIHDLHPDVVTLDLEMPRVDGLETLRRIMRQQWLPVVIVSVHSREGASSTFKALGMGAVDFILKPESVLEGNLEVIARDLIAKLKTAAGVRRLSGQMVTPPSVAAKKTKLGDRPAAIRLLAIGVSTGGPCALEYVLAHLPAEFPAAVAIVQHMPVGFTEMFAHRLDESCALEVKEAQSGDLLLAGRVLIAPGDRHLRICSLPLGNLAVLSDDPPECGHRPSADVLFRSVAQSFGRNATGLLMTGMGEDGAAGLATLREAGAITLAQDEQSSVVWGMPRAAIERGVVDRVLALEDLPGELIGRFRENRPARV